MRLPIEEEAQRLRTWIAVTHPNERSGGDWEDSYPFWDGAYAAAAELLRRPPHAWTSEQRDALIFVLGRDHEGEHVAEAVASDYHACMVVAKAVLLSFDPQAEWQVAADATRAFARGQRR